MGRDRLWAGSGLIPAWAGKTCVNCRTARAAWAHPRVGGENAPTCVGGSTTRGSSPRGRGKRHAVDQVDLLGGLIPAWAGKTSVSRIARDAAKAHPRVGGENQGGQ